MIHSKHLTYIFCFCLIILLLKNNNNNKLITTLYYKLENSQGQDVTERITYTVTPSQDFTGATIISLTNKDFIPIEDTLLSFFGYRIKPLEPVIEVEPTYTETFNVKDQDNDRFQATATYFDDGGTFATTVESITYVVTGGNGKYANAKNATIFFDNDGTKYGDGSIKFLRKIEIYS